MIRDAVAMMLCLAGAFAHLSQAVQAQTPVNTTDTRATEHVQTGQATNETLAHEWGLKSQEYARYEQLMRGPRGAFSVANISPLEVLGIHAQTPAERRAYAERLVTLLFEDTQRVQTFEREVQAAWQRLGQPMFDPSRLPATAKRLSLNPDQLWGRRLAVFVAIENCPRCVPDTQALVRMTDSDGPLIGLDVYVVDTHDIETIQGFAHRVGIAPEAVASRKITLNQGEALLRQYQGEDRRLPQIFVREDGQLHPLATATAR